MTEPWRSRILGEGEEAPDQLLANPRNWRIHPKAQQDALAGILSEVGWVQRVIVNQRTGHMVDGHARVALAISRNEPTVPVVYVDLSEEEEAAVLATFDPLSAMAVADTEQLDALLAEVSVKDDALRAMLDGLRSEPKAGLTDPDDVPELPEPISKTGDLWLCGDHRLLCGDSTKAEDVERLMAGAVPILTVSDPPYGVDYTGGASNQKERERLKGDDNADLYGPAFAGCASDIVYCWFAAREALPVYSAVIGAGFVPRSLIIWNKLNAHYGAAAADYKQRHEPCLYSVRKGCASRFIGPSNEPTVWDIPQANINELHPTQKPVECMERPIRNHDAPSVYDPFLGSGTTMIACEHLGRRCYGMEIEPRYVDVAVKRWEGFTGKEAQRG